LAEAPGAGVYAAVGVAALVVGAAFLENVLGLGTTGTLAAGGTISLLNAATGLEVTAAVVLICHEFLEEVM
jgi:multicomponent Na+:H+ antiporter subunit B